MRAQGWRIAAFALAASSSLPAVASISAHELVEVSDIDSLSASPDGKFIVFRTLRGDVVNNSYILEWHSVDLATGAVRDIGSGGQPIYLDPGLLQSETPLWPDPHSIIFRALIDDAAGLWRADVAGLRTTPFIVPDADVDEYRLAPDGSAVLYHVGPTREQIRRAERQEYDDGIRIDSSVDLAQNLYRGGSINGRMSSQRFVGYWYVRGGLLWRSPRQEHRFDLSTGVDSAAGPPEAVPAFDPAKVLPATRALNQAGDVAEASWSGNSGKVALTLASGAKLTCADPRCASSHVVALLWRPQSRDLLLTFMDGERRLSLYLWQTPASRLRKVAEGDGLLSGGRRHMYPCAISAQAAFCVASSPVSPPRLEEIDLDTGERKILFDPNAQLRPLYHPSVRYERLEIGNGRSASAIILRASDTVGPGPLYVNYYACEGFLRGGEGDEWPIPDLLDAGFTVACINAAPAPGPQDAVADYQTGLTAVQRLIEQLSKEGLVDPAKVAMGGLSFGSEVTMWTAMRSKLLAAASISSVQVEPADYWMSSIPGSDQPSIVRKVWGLGPPGKTPEQWKLLSPALNADRIDVPILFQLPEQEARRIPQLYAELSALNVPTELFAFPDEDHLKLQPRHRLAVYERNRDWFRFWLQNYRDPLPAKAPQYARWEKLREAWAARIAAPSRTGSRARVRRVRST